MILLRDLAFGRGAERLVDGASLQIHPGWKVGVVGANGTGKSSLHGPAARRDYTRSKANSTPARLG
jgi:ATPase subunit of ABC transporter with duplicated ATPase domains